MDYLQVPTKLSTLSFTDSSKGISRHASASSLGSKSSLSSFGIYSAPESPMVCTISDFIVSKSNNNFVGCRGGARGGSAELYLASNHAFFQTFISTIYQLITIIHLTI